MSLPRLLVPFAVLTIVLCSAPFGVAQKHNAGSSPPTAPPQHAPAQPIVPVSTGMGGLQFVSVNYGVPAPQSLTRQLEADDDRTRSASLAAIGAPAQYLARGHIPYPHSIQLDFVALGNTDELDAILTVELEQHLVSAILMPDDGNWRRIATIVFPTPFYDPTTTPATFLRTARSFTQPNRYRAVYRSYVEGPVNDFTENEAHLRIINNHAVVTISFVSWARTCDANTATGKNARPDPHPGCDVVQRWFQADPADPTRRFIMISASGHLSEHDLAEPFNKARTFEAARLRTFTCQPYIFSEVTEHYEPTAASAPCPATSPK